MNYTWWMASLALLAANAQAVSFDCAKAANADENAICSEVALAKLDDEFANSLKLVNANVSLPMRGYLQRMHEKWSSSNAAPRSGACKGSVPCITGKYRDRQAWLRNPHLPYEGVYLGKKTRFTLESFASGALRYAFYAEAGGAPLYFNEGAGPKVENRELLPPPPAEHCILRIEFGNDGGINVYVKEAKKKACDKFKSLAGAYARDYAMMPSP